MRTRNFIYTDTSVFMSYFNEVADRVGIIESYFDKINNSQEDILVTSSLTKVEISWIETNQYDLTLSDDDKERLDNYWKDNNLIEIIDFSDAIADIARDIMRYAKKNGWKARTMDSIHLASAKWINAIGFISYDDDFKKYEKYLSIQVHEPNPGQLLLNF
ncbi:MAG: type II toxin-antitoxin system VapC family toxin [Thermodesulfobacteriota bacterium]